MKNTIDISFASRANLELIDQLFSDYKIDPQSVAPEWKHFFEGFEFGQNYQGNFSDKELGVFQLIHAYRDWGHFGSQINPLVPIKQDAKLELKKFGLTDADLEQKFAMGGLIGKANASLKDIVAELKKTYCGTLSLQAGHASDEVRQWLIQEFEKGNQQFKLSVDHKKSVLQSLTRAECFEKFIHTRYVGAKRFSAEGAEAMLPMMDHLTEKAKSMGAQEIVLGMAHRGRLNILNNYLEKPIEYLFAEFNGPTQLEKPIEDFDSDVKYHLGHHIIKKTAAGPCEVTLAFNPSHLETVNPVVLGITQAAQRLRGDLTGQKVIPVLMHGDAAFAGQGVVMEILQMAQVKAYRLGGTIHIVVDNQIGFTTNPDKARSTKYSSDVAQFTQVPILHVNGNDVESCVRAMDIAIQCRQKFGIDVVINLICYRRFGHNEGDEPAYTQPLMYDAIKTMPTVRDLYAQKLTVENSIPAGEGDRLVNERIDQLQKIYDDTKKNPPQWKVFKFEGPWAGLTKGDSKNIDIVTETKVSAAVIEKVGALIGNPPNGCTPHPKLVKLLESRIKMSKGQEDIDWGMGEMLAIGTLLNEGSSIRMTGQDVIRGTFTHRHAGLYCSKTNQLFKGLDALTNDEVHFNISESTLSEYAVMGFEYGNSIKDPKMLTIWEAQFGDFANGAQIIIDQYLAAAESKWQQMSGLVLLLPHGYEGQGPEHSSARLERFLQLAAQNNMQVMNLTTPAQIFHALRRQVKRTFRKPMVVMSPKKLLRYPRATSKLEDFTQGQFQEVIPDSQLKDAKKVNTVIFVSGKFYYDLLEEREKNSKDNVALVRLEQIYPFPAQKIEQILKTYPNLKNVAWAQEEPKNMGAYQHVFFKFMELFKQMNAKGILDYVGRTERSSPAVGSLYKHNVEQAAIIAEAFKI